MKAVKTVTKTEVGKLNLRDVMALNSELRSLNTEDGISFVVKWDLVKLFEKTNGIVNRFNQQKTELIKKYGHEVVGGKNQFTLDGSKDYDKGMKELTELISKEEEFSFSFNIKDFSEIKSKVSYIQIFKFMKE